MSIILLHSIIPHNHSDHPAVDCSLITNEKDYGCHNNENDNRYLLTDLSSDSDESVCHFTTNLFQQECQIIFHPAKNLQEVFDSPLLTSSVIPRIEHSSHGPPLVISGYSFRAPPFFA